MAFEIIQGFNLSKNEAVDATRIVAATESDMLNIKWVYNGLRVSRLDSTPRKVFICKVATATQAGAPNYTVIGDWEEFTGTAGTDGVDGSQIYTAAGIPSDVLGVDGDFYVDDSSGDYYTKSGGTWGTASGNLVGPIGATGNTGPAGVDGDKYASTATGQSTAIPTAATTVNFTIETGRAITPGQIMIVVPDAAPSSNFIADVTSYNSGTGALVLEWSSNTGTGTYPDWTLNLNGAIGPAGADGANGTDGAAGKALIHSESDITLTEAKITTIQGGAWTDVNPWSASVQVDSRANQNTPSGIIGPMDKNSITYNGTVWSNNGRWVGQDGTNGTNGVSPYISGGNWWDSGGDTGIPATGPQGADGDGIIEYNYLATGSLTSASVLALPFDFTVPCRLNIQMPRGNGFNYVELPRLDLVVGNKIRGIRITRATPRNNSPGIITIRGRYNANAMQTYGQDANIANFLQLGIGESAVFEPVILNTGNHADYWVGGISGRGLELYTKARDYSGIGGIKIGNAGSIKGFFNFRVNNNVCHYGGYFKINVALGDGVRIDTFSLGPEVPFPFLPDPVAGPVFWSSSGLPPSASMMLPLSVNGSMQMFFSFSIGYFTSSNTNETIGAQVNLVWESNLPQNQDKLRLQVKIPNNTANQNKFYVFGGSYLTASAKTIGSFYGIT